MFRENLNKLMTERNKFKIKNERATKKFTHEIKDPQIVSGFPDDLLKPMAPNVIQPRNGPWTVTLQPHVCLPFMEFCPDREMRWNVWQAMVSRGSGYREKDFETGSHVSTQ